MIVLQSGLVFHPKLGRGRNPKRKPENNRSFRNIMSDMSEVPDPQILDTFLLSAHIVITGYAHKNSAKSKSSAKKLNS